MTSVTPLLPLYSCHKEVRAIKIDAVVPETLPLFVEPTCRGCFLFKSACGHCERCAWELARPGGLGATIIAVEDGWAPIKVDGAYLAKHKPVAGGYFVVYKDGYLSFSPAEAFEEGYTRI
jgi:hypothetical protein